MDWLVKHFNRNLKGMLRKFVSEDPRHGDCLLTPLLFAVHEIPQTSKGFSSFELLCRRQHWGIIDLVQEIWEKQEPKGTGIIEYVLQLQKKLKTLKDFAKETL